MTEVNPKDKKVLFVVAFNDYQDIEYKNTKKVFKESGVKIDVCSSSLGTARGKFGGEIKIDILINNVDISQYAAVVFIGGSGAVEYLNSEDAHNICREAVENGIILGAICMAPQVLAKSGVLNNKKATVHSSEIDNSGISIFQKEKVEYIDEEVVEDGKIITASGPDVSEEFGRKIVEKL